jgi:hypothetical protein
VVSKKMPASASEKEKHVVAKEKGPDDDEPARKRARVDPIAETAEDVDILSTPQIQPCTFYAPKGSIQKPVEALPAAAPIDPELLEASDARSKRVAEMIQKQIAMASSAPKERVAGLVDVVDKTEELCYIDDDEAPSVTKNQEISTLGPRDGPKETTMGLSESSSLKSQDPIDLDPPKTKRPVENTSCSPPPASNDINETTTEAAREKAALLATNTNVLQLEDAGALL